MHPVPPLSIALHPSRHLAAVLAAAHLAAVAAFATLGLPLWAVTGICAALAVNGWRAARMALLRESESIIALEARGENGLPYRTRAGVWQESRLLPTSYVSPWLTVLNLESKGTRRVRHVVILPDAIDGEDFRRLRAWLRWGRHREEDAVSP
jgi:toxin CptA